MSARPPQSVEFIVEAKEHLSEVCNQLLRFERATGTALRTLLEQMLRAVHSVKGGAAFFGFRNIEAVAHRMESTLELTMEGSVLADSHTVDVLLAATDRLAALLDDPEQENTSDVSEILTRLDTLPRPDLASVAAAAKPPTSDATTSAEFEIDLTACEAGGLAPLDVFQRLEQLGDIVEGRIESGADDLESWSPECPVRLGVRVATELTADECLRRLELSTEISPSSQTPSAASTAEAGISMVGSTSGTIQGPERAPSSGGSGTIRVSVGLADRLMNLAGELVLVRNQSRRFTESDQVLPGPVMQRLDAVTMEFQQTVLQTRMQPVGNLFNKFPRVVRDLARQLNKQIELRISGAEVELDKTILDVVSDPLTHLVRNACDHGIEVPAERQRHGKPPIGCIELASRHFGDQIRITISDDGNGIDREAVRRQAVKQGLRTAAELELLGDQELFGLILQPGFSTAAQVTEVSGRGVGMDVVKTNLAQLGGSIEIESVSGKGTTFTLRLPLTLAIIPSLLVTAAGQRYAIPAKDLEELVCVEAEQSRVRIEQAHDQEVVRLRGRLLPLVRLGRVLDSLNVRRAGVTSPECSSGSALVFAVVKAGARRYALVVESVLTSEEIVVKPMHGQLRCLDLFSGATILGDGRVALILNTPGIATAAQVRFGGDAEIQTEASVQGAAQLQAVLLVRHASGPLGLPVSAVRRIVMVRSTQIELVSQGCFITVDGVPTRLVAMSGPVTAVPEAGLAFVVLPRGLEISVGFVVDEVLGTELVDFRSLHSMPDSPYVMGAALLRGQITPVLDLQRLLAGRKDNAPVAVIPGTRILLVDDTNFFREVVGNYLAAAGYEVTSAENGAQALAMLDREPFDLVVSDLEMPVMDGWALAAAVRKADAHQNLPLLALTTLTGDEAQARAIASGFDALEVKLDRDSLLATVERLMQQRTRRTPTGQKSHA